MRTSFLPTRNRRIIFTCNGGQSPRRHTPRMSTGIPSSTAQVQKSAEMSTSASSNGSDLGIESTDIKTATGVSLSPQQRVLVGSVLDVLLPIHLPPSEQGWKEEEGRSANDWTAIRRQTNPQETPALDRRRNICRSIDKGRRQEAVRGAMVWVESRFL
jgi:hypothetical protein